MSYEPTQWKAGDTVTSAKLNKMEQGIAGGANILIAHATQEVVDNESSEKEASTTTTVTLDKTAREILDADFTIIIINENTETTPYKGFMYIQSAGMDLKTEEYWFAMSLGKAPFVAATEDDYPVMTLSDGSDSTPVT